MAQPGTTSRVVLSLLWLLLGAAMVAAAGWGGWTRWRVVLSGHPALLVLILATAMLGIVAVAWALASLTLGGRQDREGDPDRPHHRTVGQIRRRAGRRVGLAVPALLLCGLLGGTVAYVRPFAAGPAALAALPTTADVRLADRLTWYELVPTRTNRAGAPIKPTIGLVFYPGARVDSRAYAGLLRPLARAGYLIIVLKEPLGIALLQPEQGRGPIDVHPEIRAWAAGGHSLGGTAAADLAAADGQIKGLLLWASYPAEPVLRTNLAVTSVYGTADGLATPQDISAARDRLPSRTRYVAVTGAVHAYFADYGDQPGDGTPAVARAPAQARIVRESASLLASLRPPPARR